MMLAIPSLRSLSYLSQFKIVECGAGKGTWTRVLGDIGVDIVAIDPIPSRGDNVEYGTHEDLWKYPDRLLLVIWPPDETNLNEWVKYFTGTNVAICGGQERFYSPAFAVEFEDRLEGIKGPCIFRAGKLKDKT